MGKLKVGLAIALAILAAASAFGQAAVYYVGVETAKGYSPLGPHTCHVYQYNAVRGGLEKVWSLPNGKLVAGSVRVYSDFRSVVVPMGAEWDLPEELLVVPRDSIRKAYVVNLKNYGLIANYRVMRNQSIPSVIKLKTFDSAGRSFESKYIRADTEAPLSKSTLSGTIMEPDLTVLRSQYYGGRSDVVDVALGFDGTLVPESEDVTIDGSPVPDSIVTRKASNGWVLIANQTNYRALMCVPERGGYADKEILIEDRQSGQWTSVLIPGSETLLGLMGGWLVGVVSVENPDNDWEQRRFFGPVRTDKVVLVEVPTGRSFTVALGEQCEVLWIENDDVYYRVGDELYQARIEGDDFIDRMLLVKDRIVRGIHWTFSGRE